MYGECSNYSVLNGHKNAVMEVQWSYDSTQIVSASADKTVGVWDAHVSLFIDGYSSPLMLLIYNRQVRVSRSSQDIVALLTAVVRSPRVPC